MLKTNNNYLYSLRVKSDPLATKMINLLMRHGKRSKAEKVLSRALQNLDKNYPGQALHIFYSGVINVKQDVAVRLKPKPRKSRNKQSYNIYLPRVISPVCGLGLGIRSIIKASKDRSQSSFLPLWESLSQELLQASQNKGGVVEKKYKVHGLALSNKRRVHFDISG